MSKAFSLLVLAAALAGCAGGTPTPLDTRNDKERALPPGEGAFGSSATWEFRRKDDPGNKPAAAAPAAAPASAAEKEEFRKWRESSGNNERQEFEDWRAWQEWKRKNPK